MLRKSSTRQKSGHTGKTRSCHDAKQSNSSIDPTIPHGSCSQAKQWNCASTRRKMNILTLLMSILSWSDRVASLWGPEQSSSLTGFILSSCVSRSSRAWPVWRFGCCFVTFSTQTHNWLCLPADCFPLSGILNSSLNQRQQYAHCHVIVPSRQQMSRREI